MKRALLLLIALASVIPSERSLAQGRRPRRQATALDVQVNPAALEMVPKMTAQAVVRVRNLSANLANIRLHANAPGGWRVRLETEQLMLPAFQHADAAVLIEAPDMERYDPVLIVFRAETIGSRGAFCELPVAVLKPVEIVSVVPAFDAGGNPLTAITLRNNLSLPIQVTGQLHCTDGPRFAAPTKIPVSVKATGVATLTLEPAGEVDPVRQYDVEAQVSIVGDGTVKSKGQLNYTPCFYVGAPPALDGDLSDWSARGTLEVRDQWPKLGRAPWNGEADLHATVRFRWDQQNLYLGIEVTDNEHLQAGAQIGQQDSVLVSFSGAPRKQKKAATSAPGITLIALAVAEGKSLSEGPPGLQFAGKATETGVAYELGVPFSSLAVAKPADGTMVPLAVAINDVDETGGKTIRFFEGPTGKLGSGQYGFVLLTASTTFQAIEGEVLEGDTTKPKDKAVEGKTLE